MVRPAMIDDQRLDAALQHYSCCRLCEHDCCANRGAGERGHCQADSQARVFRHRIEVGEELELIPSHLFYLSGCDLRCAFCIAEERAFNPRLGQLLTPEFLATAVAWGRAAGARILLWVGGDPTIHLPAILAAMRECQDLPPIVWKSDFHGTLAAFELLAGVVDVYVADFKFGNNRCAERIAGVNNYAEIITRNLLIAASQADLIVRHLLLPGHEECCFRPIVRWMQDNLPEAKFSIRDGYLPRWTARRDEQLGQYLPAGSGEVARQFARDAGLRVIQ
jgi:putative pyruvate formate lyase activating enzyme